MSGYTISGSFRRIRAMKRYDSRLCNEEQLAFEWRESMRGEHIAYDHFPRQDLERLTEAVISRIALETG